ncbi:PTS transporter subunit EIIB, partial [Escherichia coli]|uniref:PTS transporter subunit EIIB n=1 Tax=Escherichia coli TaxID=562 RepID=UPI001E4419E8
MALLHSKPWQSGNIATVSHCITRLRFVLNQPANARPKEIEQLPMVKGCFTNAG